MILFSLAGHANDLAPIAVLSGRHQSIGFRDQISDANLYHLEIDAGVGVCPEDMTQFRLPLLGLSALRKNRLRLLVNGEKKYISLRAPLQR